MARSGRLTPQELVREGWSRKAARYWDPDNPGKTESNRKHFQRQSGFKTREQHTKALKSGTARYRTVQAKAAISIKKRAADIRRIVPKIVPRDVKLIDKRNQIGFRQLSDKEKAALHKLFDVYPASQIRDALGSPEPRRKAA